MRTLYNKNIDMEIDTATKLEMNRKKYIDKLVMWIAVCGFQQRDDDTALTWDKFCTFCDTNRITRLHHFTRMKIEFVENNTDWLSLTPIDRQGLCSLFGMNSRNDAACRDRAMDGFFEVCEERHEILNRQTQIDVWKGMIEHIYELSNSYITGYSCNHHGILQQHIRW